MAGLKDSDEVISDINVTPLVDVVLVLLIILMITAPIIYRNGIKIKLPSATTAQTTESTPLSFTVSAEGELLWKGKIWAAESLVNELKALPTDTKTKTATISADQTTQHGKVIELMDILQQAGITHFALTVEKKTKT